ncbi:MAG: transcriptional regulator [Mangrovibacterium sp.]
MKKYANDIIPGEAFHPCETVREELEAQGKNQSDLVRASNLNKSFISRFMKGERAISVRLALALEEVLGIPAEFWIRLQKGYESDLELIELRKMKKAS